MLIQAMKKKSGGKKRIKMRRLWNINPKTKIKENEKKYKRPKSKKDMKDILMKEIL